MSETHPIDSTRTVPCPACGWPNAPTFYEHNHVCPCCAYDYECDGDDASGHAERWDGQWWSKRTPKPMILDRLDAARAAEATQHQQFKEAVATALCVENEHGPVTEESIVEAADATLSQLFDFSARLATLRAERDRLKAALSTAAFALDLAGFRRDRDAAYAALTPQGQSTDGETR